jgi:hypothetical protein
VFKGGYWDYVWWFAWFVWGNATVYQNQCFTGSSVTTNSSPAHIWWYAGFVTNNFTVYPWSYNYEESVTDWRSTDMPNWTTIGYNNTLMKDPTWWQYIADGFDFDTIREVIGSNYPTFKQVKYEEFIKVNQTFPQTIKNWIPLLQDTRTIDQDNQLVDKLYVDEAVASVGGSDEKVKYDADDPTAGYVADKIIAGDWISVSEGTGTDENKLVIENTDKGSDVVETDPLSLHLDQTTQQKVENWTPVFEEWIAISDYSKTATTKFIWWTQADDIIYTLPTAIAPDNVSTRALTGSNGWAIPWDPQTSTLSWKAVLTQLNSESIMSSSGSINGMSTWTTSAATIDWVNSYIPTKVIMFPTYYCDASIIWKSWTHYYVSDMVVYNWVAYQCTTENSDVSFTIGNRSVYWEITTWPEISIWQNPTDYDNIASSRVLTTIHLNDIAVFPVPTEGMVVVDNTHPIQIKSTTIASGTWTTSLTYWIIVIWIKVS